jgi:hypothetical protein
MEEKRLLEKGGRRQAHRCGDGKEHLLENHKQGTPNIEIDQKIRNRTEQDYFLQGFEGLVRQILQPLRHKP